MDGLKPILAKVADGTCLTREETSDAFDIILNGEATQAQMAAFLMALRLRGETVEEITGAVIKMREKMIPVKAPADAVDIVGTGGTGTKKYNISTCAALVMAAAGVTVAKHGNRAVSSLSGSGDVLSSLGVNLNQEPEGVTHCIEEAGIGFMFAPNHHTAMRFVGPTRVELGIRTIFNLIGPLSNPARARRQLLGVYHPKWLMPFAQTLQNLDSETIWAVYGEGGLDEISTLGESRVVELKNGEIKQFVITPEEVGIKRASMAQIRGGSGDHNAKALTALLEGEKGPYRDIVLMNAAAGFVVAGKVDIYADGIELAAETIDNGKALSTLKTLVDISNRVG